VLPSLLGTIYDDIKHTKLASSTFSHTTYYDEGQ